MYGETVAAAGRRSPAPVRSASRTSASKLYCIRSVAVRLVLTPPFSLQPPARQLAQQAQQLRHQPAALGARRHLAGRPAVHVQRVALGGVRQQHGDDAVHVDDQQRHRSHRTGRRGRRRPVEPQHAQQPQRGQRDRRGQRALAAPAAVQEGRHADGRQRDQRRGGQRHGVAPGHQVRRQPQQQPEIDQPPGAAKGSRSTPLAERQLQTASCRSSVSSVRQLATPCCWRTHRNVGGKARGDDQAFKASTANLNGGSAAIATVRLMY